MPLLLVATSVAFAVSFLQASACTSASFEERDVGAASISAPVFGSTGELVAALDIGAPTQRLTPADVSRLAPQVIEAAEEASRRLGYRPGIRLTPPPTDSATER